MGCTFHGRRSIMGCSTINAGYLHAELKYGVIFAGRLLPTIRLAIHWRADKLREMSVYFWGFGRIFQK